MRTFALILVPIAGKTIETYDSVAVGAVDTSSNTGVPVRISRGLHNNTSHFIHIGVADPSKSVKVIKYRSTHRIGCDYFACNQAHGHD